MTLQAAGNSISLGDINVELGKGRTTTMSLHSAELGGYGTINTNSTYKPSRDGENKISEWYRYNHLATPIGDTTPPSTPQVYFIFNEDPQSMNMGWAACGDNVAVTGYDVSWKMGNTGASWSTNYNNGLSLTYSKYATGLETNYWFRVRARDAAGNYSSWSSTLYFNAAAAPI